MKIFKQALAAIKMATAMLWGLLPNDALDVVRLHQQTDRRHPVATKRKPRPAGSKLARKAANGEIGIARIR